MIVMKEIHIALRDLIGESKPVDVAREGAVWIGLAENLTKTPVRVLDESRCLV